VYATSNQDVYGDDKLLGYQGILLPFFLEIVILYVGVIYLKLEWRLTFISKLVLFFLRPK
jgi:hypothetical protein